MISGSAVCPSQQVEFTCIATGVHFLDWEENGVEIEDFTAGNTPSPSGMVIGPYTVFLDVVNIIPMTSTANITTRLVVNLTHLMIGDQISCTQLSLRDSLFIRYIRRGVVHIAKVLNDMQKPSFERFCSYINRKICVPKASYGMQSACICMVSEAF